MSSPDEPRPMPPSVKSRSCNIRIERYPLSQHLNPGWDKNQHQWTSLLLLLDAPCTEYLPTFTPKMAQFCRYIHGAHGFYGIWSTISVGQHSCTTNEWLGPTNVDGLTERWPVSRTLQWNGSWKSTINQY